MQQINRRGRYVAEWGEHRVVLVVSADCTHAEVRSCDDGTLVAAKHEPARSTAEAIEWSAELLEQRGAGVFVDGGWRSLADYLRFSSRNKVRVIAQATPGAPRVAQAILRDSMVLTKEALASDVAEQVEEIMRIHSLPRNRIRSADPHTLQPN